MITASTLGSARSLIVLAIGYLGFPNLRHPISQVVRGIADGVQAGISSFLTALEMGGLGDHPTAQDTNSNRVRGLFHLFSKIVYAQLGNGLSVPLTLFLALGTLNRPLDRYDHPFMQSLSRILNHTISSL